MAKYLREETEELLQAIALNDIENICEEIGDVLYILLMLIEMHQEKKIFSYDQTILSINQKLVRRHPHVFAGEVVENDADLRKQWNSIKKMEKNNNWHITSMILYCNIRPSSEHQALQGKSVFKASHYY